MVTWEIAALERQIATLKTKLAMRDQQLREADALVARLKVDVDDLRLVAVRADMQRMALSERLGSTEPETAPEPWKAIVTAAIRWRDGADRGELAAAVDAFLDANGVELANVLEARESAAWSKDLTWGEVIGMITGEPPRSDEERVLRPEQYADGAGAQAWRQAMGGKT